MRTGEHKDRGQAAVETAIVMPMMVFLLLGLLQMGLISQARVVAKYAAYRAARVGAMNNANQAAMEAAAILHLLPVLTYSDDLLHPPRSTGDVARWYPQALIENHTQVPGYRMVKLVICGPTRSEFDGSGPQAIERVDIQTRSGYGSSREVDFDDPRNFVDNEDGYTAHTAREFNRLRLRVQIQFLYKMPIPFANWVITQIYLGSTLPSVLRMGEEDRGPKMGSQPNQVRLAAQLGVYTLPINVGYAMRMQSNYFLDKYRLPASNECIHYKP